VRYSFICLAAVKDSREEVLTKSRDSRNDSEYHSSFVPHPSSEVLFVG
jgi:hypothetical protein